MAIKRYIATADNTITNAFEPNLTTRGTGSNMGAADVLESFYIHGQTSSSAGITSEKARILVQFDIDKLNTDRSAGLLPASGNVSWYLNMYNAPHSFTLPKDFKMVIKVCSGSWQEGRGLDMESYTDQTYESTGSNWIRKGAAGDGNSTWLTEGGDFAESSLSPAYTASFTDGTEDLSVDISDIVEDWMAGGQFAGGNLQVASTGSLPSVFNGAEFTLRDSQGTLITYTFDTSTTTSAGSTIGLSGANSKTKIQQAIRDAINNTGVLRMSAADDESQDPVVGSDLTMDDLGLAGNTNGGLGNIDITGSNVPGALLFIGNLFGAGGGSTVGTGIPNYGLGVFMSSSFETGSVSNYTKKFFARSSEYFLLRPNLEARWDDSKKDSAGSFYQSSSLATGEDNLNKLYLYNYVKGKLQNIPASAVHSNTNIIHVSMYSSSTGNIYDKLPLPKGGGVVTAAHHNVTGGIAIGPQGAIEGVYTASFAMSHSLSDVYAAWHYLDLVSYHTSSAIEVNTLAASNFNPDPDYVTTIENIKPSYSRKEDARFRLFVRNKNWNPNNYTVMQSTLNTDVVEDAYYSLYRISDNYEVIPFGTGSALAPQADESVGSYTRLSYDISGNYFDLDMSLLQAGYEYGLKFAYYLNGSYKEQKEVFTFKVEE
jgi:hypothetical protein